MGPSLHLKTPNCMGVIHGVGSRFIVGYGYMRQVFQSDHIYVGLGLWKRVYLMHM